MRTLLFVCMLGAAAYEAEEAIIGDYVIPPQNKLRAGIPGEYRRLFQGGLYLYPDVPNSEAWKQVHNSQSFQNLRVRFISGLSSGVDFPVSSAAADSLTVANVGTGFLDLFVAADNGAEPCKQPPGPILTASSLDRANLHWFSTEAIPARRSTSQPRRCPANTTPCYAVVTG